MIEAEGVDVSALVIVYAAYSRKRSGIDAVELIEITKRGAGYRLMALFYTLVIAIWKGSFKVYNAEKCWLF